jgi:hypothetical protein
MLSEDDPCGLKHVEVSKMNCLIYVTLDGTHIKLSIVYNW